MADKKAEQKRRRKKRLWEENPNCPHCGVLMELQADGTQKTNDRTAVLQHSITKMDTIGNPQTILCCLGCANKLAKTKLAQIGLNILRERSSPQAKCKCPNCGNKHIKNELIPPTTETN